MSSTNPVIYEPRGRAGEYSGLAANLYSGCSHRCVYCYAPACLHTTRDKFQSPAPRRDVLQQIEKDARNLSRARVEGPVLLCLTCDPYQPIDEQYRMARTAIQTLHSHNVAVKILTKGGKRAERDFDLLTGADLFGVTLTTLDDSTSLTWEPGAALPASRMNSLRKAHERGIKTWVSLEPVLEPEAVLEIIRRSHSFVDEFKVGVLNYHPLAKTIDWHRFAIRVSELLGDLKCNYHLKKDLRRWL